LAFQVPFPHAAFQVLVLLIWKFEDKALNKEPLLKLINVMLNLLIGPAHITSTSARIQVDLRGDIYHDLFLLCALDFWQSRRLWHRWL
jgi:hypothetical protein